MRDTAGFYAGHCSVFPIEYSFYERLKNKDLVEGDINFSDLVNYSSVEMPVFYIYSVYADSNDNFYYIVAALLNFFNKNKDFNYLFCGLIVRSDGIKLMTEMGLKKVWEDYQEQKENDLEAPPTFIEGKLNDFLFSR